MMRPKRSISLSKYLKHLGMGLLLLVLGGCGGFLIAVTTGRSVTDVRSPEQALAAPATDLRITLHNLFHEHLALLISTLEATLSDEKNGDALSNALDDNSQDLAASLNGIYDGSGPPFLDQWRAYIANYTDYAQDVRDKDIIDQAKVKEDLQASVTDLSSFFKKHDIDVDAIQLERAFTVQSGEIVTAVDQLSNHQYDAAYATERDAYHTIHTLADTLTQGIVRQLPEQF